MKRKMLLSVLLATFLAGCGLFSSCDKNNDGSSSPDSSTQTEIVYTLLADDISLLVGAEYKPECFLKANGETVEGATLTYHSLNTEFVSVAGEKLKAEKAGLATIEVVASVDGNKVAQESFSCQVNENKGIHPVKSSYLLYVSESVKGVSFETSSALAAFVYKNGEIVTDAEVFWSVGDESVAKIDENGRLSAQNVGETYLVGTYTDLDNETLKTVELPVKVEVPILVVNDDIIVDKANEMQDFDAQKILGENSIGSIFNASINKTYPISNNAITTSSFKAGEHTCVFYNAEGTIGVQVNLVAADFVIYNKEDLMQVPTYSSGYIALASDISNVDYVNGGNQKTFTGTFNGLGHTISNIKYVKDSSWGLFYRVNGATIKNVSIVGATLNQAAGSAFFYQTMGGETVIDNTYVDIKWDSSVWQVGGVAGYVWRGTLVYSNSILIVEGPMASNGLITGRNHSQTTVRNSYVLGEGTLSGTTPKENNNHAVLNKVAGVNYATQEAFLTAIAKGKTDFSGFNKYWDLSQDIPCM